MKKKVQIHTWKTAQAQGSRVEDSSPRLNEKALVSASLNVWCLRLLTFWGPSGCLLTLWFSGAPDSQVSKKATLAFWTPGCLWPL